jgi:hypothetical protein
MTDEFDMLSGWVTRCLIAEALLAEAQLANSQLREYVRRYSEHRVTCTYEYAKCDCGLDVALTNVHKGDESDEEVAHRKTP